MTAKRDVILVALVVWSFLDAGQASRAQDPLGGLDAHVSQTIKDWEVPGLALAVVKNDAVVLAKGFGVKKLGESTPVTDKTLFAIASCSKAFTATALAMLVDEGKIGWDDPVTKHLRDFQMHDTYAGREIRIRDLLCHRSGLPRYDLMWYGSDAGRDDLIRRLRHAKPGTSFRSQFGYQNMMFLAAGQVIPAAIGTSWDDFVRQRIFTPLGMTTSNTSTKAFKPGDDVISPHLRIEGKVQVIPWRNIDNAGPAGSINSNVAEMAQWLRLQLNEGQYNGKRLLTTKAVQEMHSPQTALHPDGMGPEGKYWLHMHPGSRILTYGLGWVIREYRGRILVQHGGSIDGNRALVILVPEEKLGFVILTNLGEHLLPEALGQWLLDQSFKAPARDWSAEMLKLQKAGERENDDAEKRIEAKRIAGTKPSLALDKYAGTFGDALYGDVKVTHENGKLALRHGPILAATLDHWHHDTFRAVWNDRTFRKGLVTFRIDRKGSADELAIAEPDWDDELVAKRVPATGTEPAIVLTPDELQKFVGVYRREAPPMEITVELLGETLKMTTFGQPVRPLVPIGKTRLRVEGASGPSYLQFTSQDGTITHVVLERSGEPEITLVLKE